MKKWKGKLLFWISITLKSASLAQSNVTGDTAFIRFISAHESFIRQGINRGNAPAPININIKLMLLSEKITSLDSINIRGTTRCLKEGSNRERTRNHYSIPFVTKGENVAIQTDPVGDFNINYCSAADYKKEQKKNNSEGKPSEKSSSMETQKPTTLYFTVAGKSKFISFYMAPATANIHKRGDPIPP